MFTVESFESSAKALAPDGIFAQWVQLYEMSPENIKTIFRTFASVYPHVVLFACEDLSSDTVLLGSFEPIEFDLERVARQLADPRVAAELERAYIFSATDVFARVLLVDKAELLDYTNGPDEELWDGLLLNTDDNAAIEFAAPRDMISFRRFAGYLATIYTDEWKYGRLQRVMRNMGQGGEPALNMAEQALSLLMNGRKREANEFLERAAEIDADQPTLELAIRIATLLTGEGGAPLPEIERVSPSATMTARQVEELEQHLDGIRRSLNLTANRDALERFARVPDHLWRRGGPQMLLLKGYLHFLNGDPTDSTECEESIEILSQLVREHEGYVIGHPEVYYFLGLCHDNALHFDKAVKNVRTFVDLTRRREEHAAIAVAQSKANLEAAMAGVAGTMPIALPDDAPGAPTTDRQGEAPKDLHRDL
jgi:tetratricopeptide (TPR) repeat protein